MYRQSPGQQSRRSSLQATSDSTRVLSLSSGVGGLPLLVRCVDRALEVVPMLSIWCCDAQLHTSMERQCGSFIQQCGLFIQQCAFACSQLLAIQEAAWTSYSSSSRC